MRARGLRGPGAPWGASLDLFTGGTFTRSTEGATIIGPATDGSTAFLQWDGVNVRRIEYDPNLPGGFGLLMEGSRTNYVPTSRDQTSWTAGSLTTIVTGGQPSPDSAGAAWRIAASSGGFGRYVGSLSVPASASVATQWQRMGGSDASWQSTIGPTTASTGAGAGLGAVYQRNEVNKGTQITAMVPVDCRDGSANGGIAAQAHDVICDLMQVEVGYWPSSAIRTSGGTGTRGADLLEYAAGQYPDSFLTNGFRFTFSPNFSSAEFEQQVPGTTQQLVYSNGGVGYQLQLVVIAGPVTRVRVMTNNAIVAQGNVTFSRGQACTVEWQIPTGLVLSGFTTGNGLSAGASGAWPAGSTLRFGSNAGSLPFFGRFGQYVEAL